MVKKKIEFKNSEEELAVCGQHDENIKLIEKDANAWIISRGNEMIIEGKDSDEEDQAVLSCLSRKKLYSV